jgi:hypothetical protein
MTLLYYERHPDRNLSRLQMIVRLVVDATDIVAKVVRHKMQLDYRWYSGHGSLGCTRAGGVYGRLVLPSDITGA